MALITRPSGGFNTGDVLTTAQWNNEFDTIVNCINGTIEAANIADGSITTAKILDGTISGTNLSNPFEFGSAQSVCFQVASAQVTATANDDWAGCATGVFKRITNTTGSNFEIKGITGGADGRFLILYNAATENMTLDNEEGTSVAANRIITCTGADVSTTGPGAFLLVYSSTDSRWILLSAWG